MEIPGRDGYHLTSFLQGCRVPSNKGSVLVLRKLSGQTGAGQDMGTFIHACIRKPHGDHREGHVRQPTKDAGTHCPIRTTGLHSVILPSLTPVRRGSQADDINCINRWGNENTRVEALRCSKWRQEAEAWIYQKKERNNWFKICRKMICSNPQKSIAVSKSHLSEIRGIDLASHRHSGSSH